MSSIHGIFAISILIKTRKHRAPSLSRCKSFIGVITHRVPAVYQTELNWSSTQRTA